MREAPSPDVPRPHSRRVLRRYWIEGALIFVFWGTLALLRVTQNVDDPLGGGPRGDAMSAGAILYTFLEYGLWLVATPLIFWLAGRLSLEGRKWPLRLLTHVAAAVGASVAIDLASHAIWNAVGEGHIRPMSVAFVLRDFHFLPELLLYLIVLATGFARSYFLRYRERVNEAARLRAEAAELHARSAELQAQLSEAHLQALRMQLNPHFLFNTLNTISAYLEQDPPGVRRMIARLSELLRYTLENTDAREVPLQQELGFIEDIWRSSASDSRNGSMCGETSNPTCLMRWFRISFSSRSSRMRLSTASARARREDESSSPPGATEKTCT